MVLASRASGCLFGHPNFGCPKRHPEALANTMDEGMQKLKLIWPYRGGRFINMKVSEHDKNK